MERPITEAERELVDAVMARDRALLAYGGLAKNYGDGPESRGIDPTHARLSRALEAVRAGRE